MRIACVLGPKFEDSEYKQPYDGLKQAGHEIMVVGLEAGAQLEGDKGTVKATVEKSFKDVRPEDFDALFRALSVRFPGAVFQGRGRGEEFEDVWVREFTGGQLVFGRGPFERDDPEA